MKSVACVLVLVALVYGQVLTDLDGDGFFAEASQGEFQDCCDSVDDGCFDPYMVNPGAWEIPNNGQADRCIEGIDAIATNVPCDWRDPDILPSLQPIEDTVPPDGVILTLVGPNVTPQQTESGIVAMDICEFKDDDDDPSWGFARQENLIFTLADGTRNGYDIGVVGPDIRQASVLSTFGNIEPANGDYFLVISTGQAYDATIEPLDRNLNLVSTIVEALPEWRRSSTRTGVCESQTTRDNAGAVFDSIMAIFSMQQPSNMNAFSLKVMYLDLEMSNTGITNSNNNFCNLPTGFESFLIIVKNDTVGTPADKNIAFDRHGNNIYSLNSNLDFFEVCGGRTVWPNNICPIDQWYIENTGYEIDPLGLATQWIPIGTSAAPKTPFRLKMGTWDAGNTDRDNVVLFDDYIPIAEARTAIPAWGYQWTSDIGLEKLVPDRTGFYPASTTSITFTYTVKNYGPEQTSDVFISFTPPKGTFFMSATGGNVGSSPQVFPAQAPFTDNSFYKYRAIPTTPTGILGVGETITGTITFGVRSTSPADLQFRITATCASIEKVFANNYQARHIYIDKL